MTQLIGFGCPKFRIAVYIGNRPNTADYPKMSDFRPLRGGDIETINQACGNGWRKVFNVYAKLMDALGEPYLTKESAPFTWQQYRDNTLLQRHSNTALLFSTPPFPLASSTVHIIIGKTYATQLLEKAQRLDKLIWLDTHFALLPSERLIVCPYFDYRQLSNAKLAQLVALIKKMDNKLHR